MTTCQLEGCNEKGGLVILASDDTYLCGKHIEELEKWFGISVERPVIPITNDWDSLCCDVCHEVKCDYSCIKWFLRKNNMKLESDI